VEAQPGEGNPVSNWQRRLVNVGRVPSLLVPIPEHRFRATGHEMEEHATE